VKEEATIDFQRFYIKIGGVRYDIKMKYVVPESSNFASIVLMCVLQVLEALLESTKIKPLSYKAKKVHWEPYQ
jgi:pyruvate decarboxylase